MTIYGKQICLYVKQIFCPKFILKSLKGMKNPFVCFFAVAFGHVMYCIMNYVNACKICHYLAHY